MPRKIKETESIEEAYEAMALVGPSGWINRDSLDDYRDLEEEL